MVVYESESYRLEHPDDAERFDISVGKLEHIGIHIDRVMCSGPEDIEQDSEAYRIVEEDGMSSLPITLYMDVDISIGQYPSDQDLADFLDVPDGTLSVDRSKPPAMGNDLPPACGCRVRN